MDDYIAFHRAKYLERERAREAERQKELAKQQFVDDVIAKLGASIEEVKLATSMQVVSNHATRVLTMLRDTLLLSECDESHVLSKKDTFTTLGLDFLQSINTNQAIVTNFNSRDQVDMSRALQDIVRQILKCCYVEDAESLDVLYDMDCSRDEELAQQLSQQQHFDLPITAPSTPSRTRRVNRANDARGTMRGRRRRNDTDVV